VAEDLGPARHLAVNGTGDLYVALLRKTGGGGIVALRDSNADGRADVVKRFGQSGGTGVRVRGEWLYFGQETAVVRYRLKKGELVPSGPAETVVDGFPLQFQHEAKSIALDDEGWLYVNVGAPSNACQRWDRVRGSRGIDPCPQLERQGGIWRFAADRAGQKQRGHKARFATGIRNAVAVAWNPSARRLYAVQHGRDQLHDLWPDLYTEEQSAELPAEELLLVREGADFGWPYCYYDQIQGKKVLAPEYGGDGRKIGRCAAATPPVAAFPGHWAPNDLLFYTGTQFPQRYRGGAFIAFHGSWNRAPSPQAGYRVTFLPFQGELPSPEGPAVFADGFAGKTSIRSPGDARFRPMGLAQGPEGSLYISDSVQGRIWRVIYRDEKAGSGAGGARGAGPPTAPSAN
jgi:glucose/arabinose dehydrogenase